MKSYLVAGLVLALLLIAALRFGPEKSVFSIGPLSYGHQRWTCADCHDGFKSFADDGRCVRCHTRQRPEPQARFAGIRCRACHREHQGATPAPDASVLPACLRCHDEAAGKQGVPEIAERRLRERRKAFHADHAGKPDSAGPVGSGDDSCLACHRIDVEQHVAGKVWRPGPAHCADCHISPHKHTTPAPSASR
jgi:hypothetical protein